ncbi:MAG TPA: N-acetylmuramoyl-L-alanine amidase [Nevskiaceae bacterium]|nr:N-acetylmuramoyl-L-alanine amidase [Nevskiaceae bacterium]
MNSIRLLDAGGDVRAVFDLTAAPAAHVFTLQNPDRVVVDLDGAKLSPTVRRSDDHSGIVRDLRFGRHDGGIRVVFDLSGAATVHHFAMPRTSHYGNRLIVDVKPSSARGTTAGAAVHSARTTAVARPSPPVAVAAARPQPSVTRAVKGTHAESASKPVAVPPTRVAHLRAKPIVVAVDAGHGGKDPGAHGPDGLDEKTVTLAVAKKLARLIDAQPGMRAVLTRRGDYYVGLRQRMEIARKADADIFISIHCNAINDPSVEGTAVYMLSQHGATSEQARWIANRENAADMVGGIDISDKSNQLASVLVDISQSATMDASFDLASRLLHQMARISPVLHAHVQRAAFVVLKAPDIPSVLVETDFITNRHEERLLGSTAYQEDIAQRLLAGIKGYFAHYRPKQRTPLRTASRTRDVRVAAVVR